MPQLHRHTTYTVRVSDCSQYSDINISQGSVATRLRCGGICDNHYITNLQMILAVKCF